MTDGEALAEAALRLVGCRFRLHGRDPATGLDCIGVLAAALAGIGRMVDFPSGYSLRTSRFDTLSDLAAAHGFEAAAGVLAAGDILFVRPGPAQMHLLIVGRAPGQLVEAHARLGRVIERVGPVIDPILQHWRLRGPSKG